MPGPRDRSAAAAGPPLQPPGDRRALPSGGGQPRLLERQRLREETRSLKAQLAERFTDSNLVGNSPAINRVFKTIEQVAPTRASVLITGESGTGKELVAAALHRKSPRADGPFVKLHCAALAETLLENRLLKKSMNGVGDDEA